MSMTSELPHSGALLDCRGVLSFGCFIDEGGRSDDTLPTGQTGLARINAACDRAKGAGAAAAR